MLVIAVASLLPAVGCGLADKIVDKVPHSVSLADRCADVMRQAIPGADIRIAERTSEGVGIDKIIAHVAGVRKDAGLPRDLAAECEFNGGGVLNAFRWTKGGPQSPQ
jgi:hypothetical protein